MQLVLDYNYRLGPYHGRVKGNQGAIIYQYTTQLGEVRKMMMAFDIRTPTHALDRIGPDGVARLLKRKLVQELADLFVTPWGELCHASELPDEEHLPTLNAHMCEFILPRTHRLTGKKYTLN